MGDGGGREMVVYEAERPRLGVEYLKEEGAREE